MSFGAIKKTGSQPFDLLRHARDIIRDEANALDQLSKNVPVEFSDAVELICDCDGAIIVTGVGKAGWIGQKISASFASTGTISHFLNPSEAFHGDLGRIGPRDVVLALSNSGETGELAQILPKINQFGVPIIAITGQENSTLTKHAQIVLNYGATQETGHLKLAPSTSTTVMLALGDALALVVSRTLDFKAVDFARFHPGGSLGRRLSSVNDTMRPLAECRVAMETETVREIYIRHRGADRRVGVLLVINRLGKLVGLFTDSDLARLLERGQDDFFDVAIEKVMTADPVTISSGQTTEDALQIFADLNLSELPVIDSQGSPIGLVDITDVVGIA